MKKTHRRELLNTIKSTKVSFVSIVFFVALAVAIFVGLSWSGDGIRAAIDRQMVDTHYYDYELIFPYGFTDSDVSEIENLDGVDEIEPIRLAYGVYNRDKVDYQVKIQQIANSINTPIVMAGRLPNKVGEVAIESDFARRQGIAIGDSIKVNNDEIVDGSKLNKLMKLNSDKITEEDTSDLDKGYLVTDTFTVTAIVESMQYIMDIQNTYGSTLNGAQPVDGLLYVTEKSFRENAYSGYTNIYIRSNRLRGMNTYGDEYKSACTELKTELADRILEITEARYRSIKEKAQETTDAIDIMLNQALESIKLGDATIRDAEMQLEQVKLDNDRVTQAIAEIRNGIESLNSDAADIRSSAENYAGMMTTIIDIAESGDIDGVMHYAENILADGSVEAVETSFAEFINKYGRDEDAQYLDTIHDLTSVVTEVARGNIDNSVQNRAESIESAMMSILGYSGIVESELQEQLSASLDASEQLKTAIETLTANIEQGRTELDKLNDEYSDGNSKADNFNEAIEALEEYDCLIATREYNVGLTSLEIVCECIDKLKYSMAMLFLIVGLLVCYSAVSRIIYSQYTRIGTKKALGMKESEINSFYFAYSGIAAVTGIVIGNIIGAVFVERAMMGSIAKEYLLYSAKTYVNWEIAVIVAAIEILLIFLCTWIACFKILKQDAVVLLAGQTVQNNKVRFFEKYRIWKKRSLLSKTIVNNFINDKRRVFATLVGIAGCIAMIVCAIMLKDNIVLGFQKQYDELFRFNEIVLFDENNDGADERIADILNESEVDHAFLDKEMATMTLPDGKLISLDLFVSTDPSFYEIVKVNQIGEAAGTTQEGVWLTHAYANEYGTKAGDTVELVDSRREIHKLKVTGFMECYLTRGLVLLSPDVYRAEFGTDVVNNAALVNIDKAQEIELNKQLKAVDGFYNINDYYEESENFFKSFTSVSGALVAVYLLLAIIMTLLVLLNLFVMFVEEKRIELIVLMINGFSVRDAKAYIYRDTIFIGIVGIIVGAVFGTLMGKETISSFENAATAMIKITDVRACLIAMIITAMLIIIMVLIAVRRIDKFELSDINRE